MSFDTNASCLYRANNVGIISILDRVGLEWILLYFITLLLCINENECTNECTNTTPTSCTKSYLKCTFVEINTAHRCIYTCLSRVTSHYTAFTLPEPGLSPSIIFFFISLSPHKYSPEKSQTRKPPILFLKVLDSCSEPQHRFLSTF